MGLLSRLFVKHTQAGFLVLNARSAPKPSWRALRYGVIKAFKPCAVYSLVLPKELRFFHQVTGHAAYIDSYLVPHLEPFHREPGHQLRPSSPDSARSRKVYHLNPSVGSAA